MAPIRPLEYALKTYYCRILNHNCDLGGNCPGCEHAALEKHREEEAEYKYELSRASEEVKTYE